jgi:hypothetical protein
MNTLLQWGTVRLNRRKFVQRSLAATFGLFAGLSVGVPRALADPICVGHPGCDPCLCDGLGHCKSGCGAACQACPSCCGTQSGCWTSGADTCCDCACRSGSFGWYCHCVH